MRHSVSVDVILPTTVAPVLDLLGAMAVCLEADVPRYKKTYKVDDSNPAVQDKIVCAREIRRAIRAIRKANKKHWNKDQSEAS